MEVWFLCFFFTIDRINDAIQVTTTFAIIAASAAYKLEYGEGVFIFI